MILLIRHLTSPLSGYVSQNSILYHLKQTDISPFFYIYTIYCTIFITQSIIIFNNYFMQYIILFYLEYLLNREAQMCCSKPVKVKRFLRSTCMYPCTYVFSVGTCPLHHGTTVLLVLAGSSLLHHCCAVKFRSIMEKSIHTVPRIYNI